MLSLAVLTSLVPLSIFMGYCTGRYRPAHCIVYSMSFKKNCDLCTCSYELAFRKFFFSQVHIILQLGLDGTVGRLVPVLI